MASLPFNYSFTTRIHDIDVAGVMFFARFFYHIHDAYEDFLNHQAQSIKQILNSNFILPISHTEADFKAPIVLNETITIEISLHKIEVEEFILSYQFLDSTGKIRSTSLTHHVCLDSNSKQRKTLPASIHQLLNDV
ncbi:MAG: acyl-CoA thioesterase [gamma proteobacterium symbiont of Lucinoma myriamae]|nr:acyl-CoA thioesterase [gamma proteobacterium symbiont of Lucinoma myriamae]MCU7819605.1 acyl-CoA thioesterase [gamma proteobacterium symbiont of Lucinoma myriamae]MCU7832271.1 acyl-CoA thioesterase [gamma proteobacterium symbiont of Lucinoma myriamae]